jgi:hypothetical protein
MLLAGEKSIREVIAFPKTTAAQDLMADSPSEVDTSQLDDLGIAIKEGEIYLQPRSWPGPIFTAPTAGRSPASQA